MEIKQIETNKISPHVRLVSYIDTPKENFYVPWRMLYDYEIYYVVEGEIEVITEDNSILLNAGDLHVMRPLKWHQRLAKSSVIKYYNIHFDFFLFDGVNDFSTYDEYVLPIRKHEKKVEPNISLSNRPIFEPIGINLPFKITVQNGAKYLLLLSKLLEHFKNQKLENELLLKADMLTLFAYLMQENSQITSSKNVKNNSITQFTQVLSGAYNEKIYIGELAEQSGLSPAQMRKIFHKVNGVSPREYLISKRINEAKYFLEEGKLSVSEIAEKVGYENVNYFSRIFKKKTGMSPTEYRSSLYDKNNKKADKNFYWCDVIANNKTD